MALRLHWAWSVSSVSPYFSLQYGDFGGVNQIATRMETGYISLILRLKICLPNFKIPVLIHIKTYLGLETRVT